MQEQGLLDLAEFPQVESEYPVLLTEELVLELDEGQVTVVDFLVDTTQLAMETDSRLGNERIIFFKLIMN